MNDSLSLRPNNFDEYIGQDNLKENLKIFIEASKIRNDSLDHILLYGPSGLGKTTMAFIIANELGASVKSISGPSIEKMGDIVAVLSSLNSGDVLFIDEIHRIPKFVEEALYSAMEDFSIDLIIGAVGDSKKISIDLPPFTLVGATTKAGDLSKPLRDRFGFVCKFNLYSEDDIYKILVRNSKIFNIFLTKKAGYLIASRSRGVPRVAINIFKRICDFALVKNIKKLDVDIVLECFSFLNIDSLGLNELDVKIMLAIINKFNCGPVGLGSLAIALGEDVETISKVHEPYLIQIGLLERSLRGRVATSKAVEYFGRE